MITDQDKEIEVLKAENKKGKEKLLYELAEIDNTIKRYKKEIDSTREFAISKFAKELLDVKDSLELGLNYIKKINVTDETDINVLKTHFEEV